MAIQLLNNKFHGLSPTGSHHSLLLDQRFQKMAGWDWSERHLTGIGMPSDYFTLIQLLFSNQMLIWSIPERSILMNELSAYPICFVTPLYTLLGPDNFFSLLVYSCLYVIKVTIIWWLLWMRHLIHLFNAPSAQHIKVKALDRLIG